MRREIVLARHAKARANVRNVGLPEGERTIGEPSDGNPLTDGGREQAQQLGRLLQPRFQETDDIVVACSQADRAIETCLLSLPGTPYVSTASLNEIHKGAWEGQRVSDVITPQVRRELDRLNWYFRPPGGESRDDACRRPLPFIRKLIGGDCQQAILFSHVDLIRSVLTVILGLDKTQAYRISIANASLSIVGWDGQWQRGFDYWAINKGVYVKSRFVQRDGKLVQEK